MARRKGGAHGGHGWFVTFADLMGLLLSFFVVVVASSTQEKEKMLAIAGSFREAFGNNDASRFSGVIEIDGVPTRNKTKNVGPDIENAHEITTPEVPDGKERALGPGGLGEGAQELLKTETAIRQALQETPELADLSSQVVFEERPEGLAVELVDQDGRSMFADGTVTPNPRVTLLLQTIARELATHRNKISVIGHTASREGDGRYLLDKGWELSAMRALKARDILGSYGLSSERFSEVSGRSSSEPYFDEDPSLAANRRVTILLSPVPPALPAGHLP